MYQVMSTTPKKHNYMGFGSYIGSLGVDMNKSSVVPVVCFITFMDSLIKKGSYSSLISRVEFRSSRISECRLNLGWWCLSSGLPLPTKPSPQVSGFVLFFLSLAAPQLIHPTRHSVRSTLPGSRNRAPRNRLSFFRIMLVHGSLS